MCQPRVQWHGVASNRNNVFDNAGVYVATLQVQLSHCRGCIPLEQLCKHPTAGGCRKNRQPVQDFCEKNLREEAPSFLQKYGSENPRKNSDHVLRFLVLVRLQGFFLKISHQAMFFFSLTPASVELAMLPAYDPRLSTKCSLSKSSKALQRVLVVPAWQGTLHKNNHEKIPKNLIARFCTGRGATSLC